MSKRKKKEIMLDIIEIDFEIQFNKNKISNLIKELKESEYKLTQQEQDELIEYL